MFIYADTILFRRQSTTSTTCMHVFMNMQKIHGISLCIVHKQQQHLNDDDDDDGREKNGFVVVTHR